MISLATVEILACNIAFPAAKVMNENTQLFMPCTKFVHSCAINATSESKARLISVGHYFAKPIDRVIQAAVNPIFRVIEIGANIKHEFNRGGTGYLWSATCLVCSPVTLIFSGLESIIILANGILQVFVPYQAIYSICKGKEAAREFSNYRQHLINADHHRRDVLHKPGIILSKLAQSVLRELFGYPRTTYRQLYETHSGPTTPLDRFASFCMIIPNGGITLAALLCLRPSVLHTGLRRLAVC